MSDKLLLSQAIKSKEFIFSKAKIPILIGVKKDTGEIIVEDLSKMRHILIGGTKDRGKSELIKTIIMGIKEKNLYCQFVVIGNDISTDCTFSQKDLGLDVQIKVYDTFDKHMDDAIEALKYVKNECINRMDSSGKEFTKALIVIIDYAIDDLMDNADARDILGQIFTDLCPPNLNIHFIISDIWLGKISNQIMCEIPARIAFGSAGVECATYHTLGVDKYLKIKDKIWDPIGDEGFGPDKRFYFTKNFQSVPVLVNKIIND